MISTIIVTIAGPGLWNAALVGACELVRCAGAVVYTKPKLTLKSRAHRHTQDLLVGACELVCCAGAVVYTKPKLTLKSPAHRHTRKICIHSGTYTHESPHIYAAPPNNTVLNFSMVTCISTPYINTFQDKNVVCTKATHSQSVKT